MIEYYESASRSELYETTSGARCLRRYKLPPAYRLQLRRAILDAGDAELRVSTHIEKKRNELRKVVAQLELDSLESGVAPSALSGFIALKFE